MVVKKKVPETGVTPAPAKSTAVKGKDVNNEIDAIFGNKKRKGAVEKQETPADETVEDTRKSRKKKGKKGTSQAEEGEKHPSKESKKAKIGKSSDPSINKTRRKTADGLTLYSEDEIKWNSKNAGGTPLCPFDCECCF